MKKWSFVFKLNGEFAIDLRIVIRHARNALATTWVRPSSKKRVFLVLCTLFDNRPKLHLTNNNNHASWVTLHTVSILVIATGDCAAPTPTKIGHAEKHTEIADIEDFCATGNDNGLVFLANAVKQGWPYQLCSEKILVWTHRPRVCTATQITANMLHDNVENYVRDEFSRNERRRGVGLV
jgi:hypothetical protein